MREVGGSVRLVGYMRGMLETTTYSGDKRPHNIDTSLLTGNTSRTPKGT